MTYAQESIDSPRAKSDQLHACRHKWQLHSTDYYGSSPGSSRKKCVVYSWADDIFIDFFSKVGGNEANIGQSSSFIGDYFNS